jgi:hypothetical protein
MSKMCLLKSKGESENIFTSTLATCRVLTDCRHVHAVLHGNFHDKPSANFIYWTAAIELCYLLLQAVAQLFLRTQLLPRTENTIPITNIFIRLRRIPQI